VSGAPVSGGAVNGEQEDAAPSAEAAAAALRAVLPDLAPDELVRLPAKGTSHAHWRVGGRGLVLRVPRRRPAGLDPLAEIERQAAAFARAQRSARAPGLAAVLHPAEGLPAGALLVEDVTGRPPRLPDDLPAIAGALAAIHSLPLPPPGGRPPLADPSDPLRATAALVRAQAVFLAPAGAAPDVAREVDAAVLEAEALPSPGPAAALVGVDVHPGNFAVLPDGTARLLDLERMQYGLPALDLAHAVLDTSTTFDPDVDARLSDADVAAFVDAWAAGVPEGTARDARALLPAALRLVRARTLTWMARWRARDAAALGPGLDPAVRAHVEARVDAALGLRRGGGRGDAA
jgi:hypothetical protein